VYSTVLNASEVNKLFSIERIACVETKSTTVKREEYIDLSNYCNNYNLRLDSTEGLKVYDENLNEITEGLDKLLLRCLLSRDISLKVKYDDYIALAGNIRSVTWDEYRLFRSASSLLGIELNRAFHTCENAVVNHIRQKFLDNGVPKDIFYKRNRYFTLVHDEPKFGNTKSLYSLAEIEEKCEFLCLENELYKALKFDALPSKLWVFPSLYFTKGDYITKSSNAMFKLFITRIARFGTIARVLE
jgi:hypothetical protein